MISGFFGEGYVFLKKISLGRVEVNSPNWIPTGSALGRRPLICSKDEQLRALISRDELLTPPKERLDCRARLATPTHAPFAQEKPIERDALLRAKRDQKICMGGRSILVSIDVLLEHAEVPCELALGAIAPNFGETFWELLLDPLEGGTRHVLDP
jgi:hypothetical protein